MKTNKNVISILKHKEIGKEEVVATDKSKNNEVNDFLKDAMNKNVENTKRMKQTRLKLNKAVLRSYKIKS